MTYIDRITCTDKQYNDALTQICEVIEERIELGMTPDELMNSLGLNEVFGGEAHMQRRMIQQRYDALSYDNQDHILWFREIVPTPAIFDKETVVSICGISEEDANELIEECLSVGIMTKPQDDRYAIDVSYIEFFKTLCDD